MRLPERFKAGETLKSDIGPKLNAIVEFIKSLIPHGDGRTIMVRHSDNGAFFSSNARGGGPGGGASDPYSGPFAVSLKENSETTVVVKEGNVIAGITETTVPETDVLISGTCVLYLELTYDNGYVAELKTAAEMPTLEVGKYQKKLASVTVEDSKISAIAQVWEAGDIEVIGRLT